MLIYDPYISRTLAMALRVPVMPRLTDLTVLALASLPRLARLAAAGLPKLTDQAAFFLAEHAPALEHLHLSYCVRLTLDAVQTLLRRLTKLQSLSLSGVPALQRRGVRRFADRPREVSIVCTYIELLTPPTPTPIMTAICQHHHVWALTGVRVLGASCGTGSLAHPTPLGRVLRIERRQGAVVIARLGFACRPRGASRLTELEAGHASRLPKAEHSGALCVFGEGGVAEEGGGAAEHPVRAERGRLAGIVLSAFAI